MLKTMIQPPDTSGGGGFTFEDAVVALYLGALLGEESAPGLEGRIVTRVAVQQANFGEPLDDLIVDGIARDKSHARLSLQSKRELTISDAPSNTDFREVVGRAWKTLAKPSFRESIDRVGAVTGTVAEGTRRVLQDVCEWARSSTTSESFSGRFQPSGAGQERRDVPETFRNILTDEVGGPIEDACVYRLLRHFVLVKFDLLHEGATDEAHAIEKLRMRLQDPTQADSLWNRLRTLARDAAGRAGEFDRNSLLIALRGAFEFKTFGQSDGGKIIANDVDKTIAAIPEPGNSVGRQGVPERLDDQELRRIATELLASGSPPSLLPLFPGAAILARQALEQFARLRRTVTDERADGQPDQQKVILINELLARDELHHLLLAPPGSGKTHALWHVAREMLAGGGLVPIFIPLGGLATWDDAVRAVADLGNGVDVTALFRDTRVCAILDGWSEFALGCGIDERTRAMRVLSRTRVIANGRLGMASDTPFRIWRLDPPSATSVRQAIRTAHPQLPPPVPALIELLRLPLALSLFILLGGSALTRGELLTRLHDHLSRNFPEIFRDILAGAVASMILSRQSRSYVRLKEEIRERATQASLTDPVALLLRLGTLEDRAGMILPVHDLYWSWLGGLGLLGEDRIADSLPYLATHECYELALESGARPKVSMVATAIKTDITLAGLLNSELGVEYTAEDAFLLTLRAMFTDDRLAVRGRAALAALRSRRADFLRSALDVLTEICEAKLYVGAFDSALIPADLYPNRGIIAEWLGASGTDQLIDAVAYRGDASWGTWLEQMAKSGKLSMSVAVAATLACEARVPEWTVEHLPALINSYSWKLHAVASRGTNIEFAGWLVEHYDEFVGVGNSKWYDLNKVLVGCGDDATFERLLSRFSSMASKAQETLGFAIVDRGDPWVGRFQEKAFTSGALPHHHKLAEVVSLRIDDATARRWIKEGPSVLGWRVLIARHGGAIVPEMVANLPDSFDGLHNLPALSAMRFLIDAPESLVNEIMKRIRGNIQPKAMQDAINALARVRPAGIPAIVAFIAPHPHMLPTYHLAQFLGLLQEWQNETNVKLIVKSNLGVTSFAEWILLTRFPQDRSDPMFSRAVSYDRDLAIRIILQHLRDDEKAIKEIIGQIEPMTGYHEPLFELLITNPNLCTLVPKVFLGAFDTFPESALLRTLDTPGVDLGELLRGLSASSTPAHSVLHKVIITKVLSQPLDLSRYRYVAKTLRVYPRESLFELLKSMISEMAANEMWLIREVEAERGELLVDEGGKWLT
jgi:hypothetical protein